MNEVLPQICKEVESHRTTTLNTGTSIKMEYVELALRRPCLSMLAALDLQDEGEEINVCDQPSTSVTGTQKEQRRLKSLQKAVFICPEGFLTALDFPRTRSRKYFVQVLGFQSQLSAAS